MGDNSNRCMERKANCMRLPQEIANTFNGDHFLILLLTYYRRIFLPSEETHRGKICS